MMAVKWLDSAPSTNTLMVRDAALYAHGDVLAVREQTAGRGQRGNSWEAEPGKNLSFSLMLRPQALRAADAYHLSMTVSVGIVKALRRILGLKVELKWPNDIYVGDKKLAGILIENSFSGSRVGHAVVGIGLNVNQTEFRSDAPNPVSMAQIAGHEFDLHAVLNEVVSDIVEEFNSYEANPDVDSLVNRYSSWLWRREGVWPWHDNLRDETVMAAIGSVASTGHLTLALNPPRTYAFKEITAIL